MDSCGKTVNNPSPVSIAGPWDDHHAMTGLSIFAALAAACSYALAVATQHRTARSAAQAEPIALMFTLLRSPWWWLGVGFNALGLVLYFVALSLGPLLLVQPLIMLSLFLAIVISARLARQPLSRADVVSASTLTVSLAVFIGFGQPVTSQTSTAEQPWAAALISVAIAVCILIVTAAFLPAAGTAPVLGVATGLLNGAGAALKVLLLATLSTTIVSLFTSWETYAFVAVVIVATVIQQFSYQTAPLPASLPSAKTVELLTGATLSIVVLGEHLGSKGWQLTVAIVAIPVALVSTYALARTAAAESVASHTSATESD